MLKESTKECQKLEKLSKKAFRFKADAMEAFKQWQKQSKLCQAEPQIAPKPCYKGKGRAGEGKEPDHLEYYISGCCLVSV